MQFALIGRLTRESLAAFIKDPIDRSGPASALIETVGGKMQHMWQTPEGVVIIILDAGLFNAQYMTRMARIALMPPKAMRCRPSETL